MLNGVGGLPRRLPAQHRSRVRGLPAGYRRLPHLLRDDRARVPGLRLTHGLGAAGPVRRQRERRRAVRDGSACVPRRAGAPLLLARPQPDALRRAVTLAPRRHGLDGPQLPVSSDDVGNGLEARPMLGFSWGFLARGGEITLVEPTLLDGAAWDGHLDTLRERHPAWHFSTGLADLSQSCRHPLSQACGGGSWPEREWSTCMRVLVTGSSPRATRSTRRVARARSSRCVVRMVVRRTSCAGATGMKD